MRHFGRCKVLTRERIEQISSKSRLAPCIASLGIDVLTLDNGYGKLTARHLPEFNGVLAGFHGGMLAMVADCAAWFAIVTETGPDEPLVTTDLFIRYLAPCVGDVTVEARAVKIGRTLCPVSVQMFDPAGKQVALAVVTYARIANDVATREAGEKWKA
jgi:uncharacterized protein (TIGR00369 family)